MVEPVENTGEIAQLLLEVENGDELTVETESGVKINREVSFAKRKESGEYEVFVGDPLEPHVILYVEDWSDEYSIDVCQLTEDPDNPVRDVGNIVKVWFW